MVRVRKLPTVAELLASLEEAGVTDAPRQAPDEESLRGLLDTALWFAEHRKRVSFPAFSWSAPEFVAADAKVTMRVAYARFEADDNLRDTLLAHLPRVGSGMAILALDAHTSGRREFDVLHELYGRVTLFRWPTKPAESADPRVHAAQERGWGATLKAHNLLPGRGIVVLDEDQGLLLREPELERLLGLVLLLPDGHTTLHFNPLVEADRNDAELQYWMTWGEGTGSSSEWRELLRAGELPES